MTPSTVKRPRVDAKMVLVLVLAATLIVGLLLSDVGKAQVLISGPVWPKVQFAGLAVIAIVSFAGAQWVLERSSSLHTQALEMEAANRREALESAIAQQRRDFEEEQKQRAVLQREVRQLQLSGGFHAVVGQSAMEDDVTQRTRVSVLDSSGREVYYLVFHLYRHSAFWEYEGYRIEGPTGANLTLAQLISRSPSVSQELPNYDYVIGVGIASNPQDQSPPRLSFAENLSNERASLMCASLLGASSLRGHRERVWGMALGRYTDAASPPRSDDERAQRAVVIIGVKRVAQSDASVETLVREIIAYVNLPGLDVSRFSRAQPPSVPTFFRMSECRFPG